MIIVVDGVNADQFQGLLSQVFELRARVFRDRLGWDVEVIDGQERDHFDDLFPTHIVSVNDDGKVAGSMRLLQTTGPNMLADVFSSILQGQPAPRSPLIWEATRFCVDTNLLESGKSNNSISYVTSEVTAMAALMDCSAERIEAVRSFANIKGSVFIDEEEAIERFGDENLNPQTPEALDAIRSYMFEQLNAATDPNELRAAIKVLTELQSSSNQLLTESPATHS